HSHEVNERPEPIIQEKPDTQEEYRSKEVHNRTESEQPVVNTTATNAYGLEMEEERKSVPGYLLNDPLEPNLDDEEWITEQQRLLDQTLKHFKVDAQVVNVTKGPSVTRFEIQPALGVKVSRI